MNRDDFNLLVIGLLLANLAAIFLVGRAIIEESARRPARIIHVHPGGRDLDERAPREGGDRRDELGELRQENDAA